MNLSYVDLNLDRDGCVLGVEQIRELRLRKGYCPECRGQPVRLFNVRKCRFNPLWTSKEPLTVEGFSIDGQCLVCHPELNPEPLQESFYSRRSSDTEGVIEATCSLREGETVDTDDRHFSDGEERDDVDLEVDSIRDLGIQLPSDCDGSSLASYCETQQGGSASSTIPESPLPSTRNFTENELDFVEDRSDYDSILCQLESFIIDLTTSGNSHFTSDVVVSTMRNYPDVDVIQSFCLAMIRQLCKDNDDNRELIISAGALEDILTAMKNHVSSPLVQERGCRAIKSLAMMQPSRILVATSVAPTRIISAILEHKSDRDLVRSAIGALRMLSPESEVRAALGTLEATPLISEIMSMHRSVPAIQRDGCALLSNMSVDENRQRVSVATHDELDAIVQAMVAHHDEPSVMTTACFALKNYTYEERNIRKLRHCSDVSSLLLSALESGTTKGCEEHASDVLERLEMSRAKDESLEELAYESLMDYVRNAPSRPDATRRVIDVMNEHASSPKIAAGGLECLATLARQAPIHRNRMTKSVLKETIARMEQYETNACVQKSGCRLLTCLTEDDERNHLHVIDARGCQAIVKGVQLHQHDENVVIAAFSALRVLSKKFECWSELAGTGCTGAIQDAMRGHPDSEIIQHLALEILADFSYHATALSQRSCE